RADVEHAAIAIQTLQGGNGLSVIMKLAVVIVLDDRRADRGGEGEKFLSARDRHEPSRRVLMGRCNKNHSWLIGPVCERQAASIEFYAANAPSCRFAGC